VSAGADTYNCLGQNLTLQATGAAGYTWLPPSSSSLSCNNCPNPVASPTVTTSYFVTGTSPDGCQATDTITVKVNLPVTVSVNPSAEFGMHWSKRATYSKWVPTYIPGHLLLA